MIIIYEMWHPFSNKRYVGKTSNTLNKRLDGHIKDSKKSKTIKTYWIKKLIKNGLEPIMTPILFLSDNSNWKPYEIFWIAEYKRLYGEENILNDPKCLGGEGFLIGNKLSEETKKKISISKTGSKRSEETKEKISKSLKGNSRKSGHKMPETAKIKISESNKDNKHRLGKIFSQESIIKMSESHIGNKNHFFGKNHSDESKNKISISKRKISNTFIEEIFNKYNTQKTSYPKLAKEYGVCTETIRTSLKRYIQNIIPPQGF